MKLKRLALFWLFFVTVPGLAAFRALPEVTHDITHSGGIAAPSSTSALGENPSGLVYNNHSKFFGALASNSDSFDPLGLGGFFYSGNGGAGLGLGLQTFNSKIAKGSTITLAEFGVAAEVSALNMAVGVDGHFRLASTGPLSGAGASRVANGDVGFIYNPNGQTRVGGTAFEMLGGISALGAGIATDLNSSAIFAVDATTDKTGKGLTVKPALSVSSGDLQLMVGYGIQIDKKAGSWMRLDTSVGLGYQVSSNIHFEFYYNQLAKYFAGISSSF